MEYAGSSNTMRYNGIEAMTRYTPYGQVNAGEAGGVRYYTGKEWDRVDDSFEADLYYYGARYYDPDLGMFLQPDPMMQFPSPYLYTGGNPVNRTDPSGMLSADETASAVNVDYNMSFGKTASSLEDDVRDSESEFTLGGIGVFDVDISSLTGMFTLASDLSGYVNLASGSMGGSGGMGGNRPGPLSSIPNFVTTVISLSDIIYTMGINMPSVINFRFNAPAIFASLIADSTALGSTYIPGNAGTYLNLTASAVGTYASYVGGTPFSVGISTFGFAYTVGTIINNEYVDPKVWGNKSR